MELIRFEFNKKYALRLSRSLWVISTACTWRTVS